ncbi:hypothetical protein LCGC14_1044770 [marine sediment metagenome]|uniref:Nuclease associated modular domain-containing protein n=1 Tax=marine sediment metagenome TaxID=412755 RepID=A0A0F9NCD2_9ZZZZ
MERINYYLKMTTKRYKQTKEHKKRIGIANAIKLKGRKLSEKTKMKMSVAKRKRIKELGYMNSQETRKKLSEIMKNKWANGEVTEKQRNNIKEYGIKTQFKKDHQVPKKWREAVKENRAKQIFPKTDSSIEVKIQNYLKELKIEFFTHQYIKIKHGYQCDILIPSMNLVIECDGNYWHKFPMGLERDHIRTKELIEKGFKVLRLWESEIKTMKLNDFKRRLINYAM